MKELFRETWEQPYSAEEPEIRTEDGRMYLSRITEGREECLQIGGEAWLTPSSKTYRSPEYTEKLDFADGSASPTRSGFQFTAPGGEVLWTVELGKIQGDLVLLQCGENIAAWETGSQMWYLYTTQGVLRWKTAAPVLLLGELCWDEAAGRLTIYGGLGDPTYGAPTSVAKVELSESGVQIKQLLDCPKGNGWIYRVTHQGQYCIVEGSIAWNGKVGTHILAIHVESGEVSGLYFKAERRRQEPEVGELVWLDEHRLVFVYINTKKVSALKLLDLEKEKAAGSYTAPGYVSAVWPSPDGRYLFVIARGRIENWQSQYHFVVLDTKK